MLLFLAFQTPDRSFSEPLTATVKLKDPLHPRTVLSSRGEGKTNFAQELFGGEWLLNEVVRFRANEQCASLGRAAGD